MALPGVILTLYAKGEKSIITVCQYVQDIKIPGTLYGIKIPLILLRRQLTPCFPTSELFPAKQTAKQAAHAAFLAPATV